MAHTAPLSRRFYDTFGDENTNELVGLLNAMDATYLTELRTLNETNFARFDAKLEQRIAELGADLRTEFRTALADLRVHTDAALADLRAHMKSGLADLRTHTDVGFAHVRGEMSAGFGALRSEVAKANLVALRWFIGLTVTTLVTVAATLISAALK